MKERHKRWVFRALIILLPLLFLLSLTMGAVKLPLREIFQVLQETLGLRAPLPELNKTRAILLSIRLPRSLAALFAGLALSVSGASMQGLFQNPMASPDILGVSAGASLGAVIAITLGVSLTRGVLLPLLAVGGGVMAAVFVYLIASRRGKTHLLFVILGGLALSSLLNGIISSVLLLSEEYEISQFIHWTMGGLEGRMWKHLMLPIPLITVGAIFLFRLSGALNLLSQGEEQAHSLGLAVEPVKLQLLFFSTLLTAMAISLAGPVGFVGLLMPHLVRLLTGADHRRLLPYSALAGSSYLLLCDLIGRRAFAPHEIKIGIITSLIGAPYFIYLIIRYQKRGIGQ